LSHSPSNLAQSRYPPSSFLELGTSERPGAVTWVVAVWMLLSCAHLRPELAWCILLTYKIQAIWFVGDSCWLSFILLPPAWPFCFTGKGRAFPKKSWDSWISGFSWHFFLTRESPYLRILASCLKIGRLITLWRTMILVGLFQTSIYVGTEKVSRLRTQPEIQTRSMRSNTRMGIYKEFRMSGPSAGFHHEPERINTWHAILTSNTVQCTTSVMTARGPYQLEGARWHLLTEVFSNPTSFEADLHSELPAAFTKTFWRESQD